MTVKLQLEAVKASLTKKKAKKVTQEIIDEMNQVIANPDFGESLAENYMNFIGVLRERNRCSLAQYHKAIMFYTLVEGGSTLVKAYMQVFPDRVAYRRKLYPERSSSVDLAHESSRYNRSNLVMDIRKTDTLSVKLIHRNLLHEAILKQADLMRTAKSELVQQKASETLMRELKPDEEANINLNINDGSTKVLEDLRKATAELAKQQFGRIIEGTAVKDIAASKIVYNVEGSDG